VRPAQGIGLDLNHPGGLRGVFLEHPVDLAQEFLGLIRLADEVAIVRDLRFGRFTWPEVMTSKTFGQRLCTWRASSNPSQPGGIWMSVKSSLTSFRASITLSASSALFASTTV
jgi:hypothetical protein